jgi:hypothetical protein
MELVKVALFHRTRKSKNKKKSGCASKTDGIKSAAFSNSFACDSFPMGTAFLTEKTALRRMPGNP